jgi:hypothetical protein
VVLSNWVSGWVNPVYSARNIADIYLEAHLKKAAPPTPTSKTKEIKPDSALYDKYVGDYRWEPGYVVNILREKGRLMLQTPRGKYQLLPQSETEFKLSIANYRFTFQTNKEGKVHQMLIQPGGRDDVIAPRIKLVNPTLDELKEFTGTYYCQELDTRYSIILQDKKLVITHLRISDISLTPESRDHFTTNSTTFRMVEFLRDKQQKVSGFKMTGFQITFKKI